MIEKQIQYLAENIPGITEEQARPLLEEGYKRNSSIVFGGSRVRGDYRPDSDLDVGFGSLKERQAQRVIHRINKIGPLRLESHIQIVPGKKTESVPQIISPEEFFQRSGTRSSNDPRAGEPYLPSGSVTVTPDGEILIIPAGKMLLNK
ncbi:MAG: hypothetical protein DRI57_22185 [Deltaproteobacteria bacterium]|nr:MAG: hypothetical protein DRI57_22185 [Deltaproteobacteria bacterium]